MAFAAPALPFITAATSVAAAAQAEGTAKYNQSVQNRNALIYEQEKERLEGKLNFDLARFDDQFRQFQGKTTTAILTSGAELSGSGLRVLQSNAEQAEIEKNVMEYNTKVASSQVQEKANFARIEGKLARMKGKQAQIGYLSQAGTSLLSSGVFES